MKKLILFFPFFLLTIAAFSSCFTQEKFPIDCLSPQIQNSGNVKIVLITPSISDSTEYSSMIVQAFKYYFVEKLAFDGGDQDNINIDIIFLSDYTKNASPSLILEYPFDTQGMHRDTITDEKLNKLNIPKFTDNNASSILFLLDGNNNVILQDDDYRGQGEHLKPLERKIKELLGVKVPRIEEIKRPDLKVGDKAPLVDEIDFDEQISVLTFYPAAFSGILPSQQSLILAKEPVGGLRVMMCAVQIPSLDRISVQNGKYYAISGSTPELLQLWKEILKTNHINYINDANYDIAQAFGAYNENGYSNRITVIVDKNGNIAYIDYDYTIEKEAKITEIVNELSKK